MKCWWTAASQSKRLSASRHWLTSQQVPSFDTRLRPVLCRLLQLARSAVHSRRLAALAHARVLPRAARHTRERYPDRAMARHCLEGHCAQRRAPGDPARGQRPRIVQPSFCEFAFIPSNALTMREATGRARHCKPRHARDQLHDRADQPRRSGLYSALAARPRAGHAVDQGRHAHQDAAVERQHVPYDLLLCARRAAQEGLPGRWQSRRTG
jgi:hypothetical protein